ncbi:glycosyltransferase family 4 protein [Bradyrhizobium sp. ORS 111]|uniref:glycosyltransferase family 4 protein n=1 Tax=Bradyrhizobium sp. ORS 111 TaxID=1685958 RepID=UPI00388D4FD9
MSGPPDQPPFSRIRRHRDGSFDALEFKHPTGARKKLRVAFINTHPIQYFAPLYAYLNQSEDFTVSAIYLSDYSIRGAVDDGFAHTVKWDIDLLTGYNVRFVPGADRRGAPTGFLSMVVPELWREVRSGGFSAVIVHGHTPVATLIAAAAARAARIPVFMRSETHLGLRRSRVKNMLRRPVIGACYRWFDGVLAIGSANHDFYRAMGVPERCIFTMPYTVDNDRFIAASHLSTVERAELRAGFGVTDDRPVVLFAAKFQHRKRPDDLLRAASRLRDEKADFHLLMIGSGEMETELRFLAQTLSLDNIHFAGFVNQAALPRYYAASDIFVLPSENEPWGLAVNEAMCAGMPIVASSEIGCARDLVRNGVNGRTFAAGDITGLADALMPLIANAEMRRLMGRASKRLISRWSYAECEVGLRQALTRIAAPAAWAT